MTVNKVILVDVDDTIANTRQAILDYYRLETGDYSTSIKDAKGYWYTDGMCPKFTAERCAEAFNDPKLFKLLKPLEGAKEGIAYLQQKGYEVRICTLHNAMGIALKDKWLDYNFPTLTTRHYSTMLGGNKDVFCAYSIIDDNIKNISTSSCDVPILLDFFEIQNDKVFDKRDKRKRITSWKELIEKEIL